MCNTVLHFKILPRCASAMSFFFILSHAFACNTKGSLLLCMFICQYYLSHLLCTACYIFLIIEATSIKIYMLIHHSQFQRINGHKLMVIFFKRGMPFTYLATFVSEQMDWTANTRSREIFSDKKIDNGNDVHLTIVFNVSNHLKNSST